MSSSSNDSSHMETPPLKVETTTPSSSSVTKTEFHPALVVSNIMNNIPIVLDMETNRYGAWAELFRVHARSHWILHHIVPSENKPPPPLTDLTYDYWTALDAIVL